MKLMLGTAQFGQDYGISNCDGRPSREDIVSILEQAGKYNITFFDTAPAYGKSELILGTIAREFERNMVSKIPRLSGLSNTVLSLKKSVSTSLKNLGESSLYALLMHDANDLLASYGDDIYKELQVLKDTGIVQKIGISVYSRDEIESVISRYQIDLIQLPINIFDQRMLSDGFLISLKKKGIEIHARSVFLQGLLLMQREMIPGYFSFLSTHIDEYFKEVSRSMYTKLDVAIGFVKSIQEIDKIVVGVNNLQELVEIYDSYQKKISFNYADFAIESSKGIDPREWIL